METDVASPYALEEARCHGWIDGQVKRRDEPTYKQRFTPRRKNSPWSKRNVGIAERLVDEGRMHAAGVAEVERAKADGRWEAAYAGAAAATVPDDLAAALAADPVADAFFRTLGGNNRYSILYRIQDAKKPETRAKRIAKFIAMLNERKTLY